MKQAQEKTTSGEVVVENETSKDIIPQRNALVKQTADIDGFLEKRKEFIEKVSAICVEGKDYHVIQGKKSLAKGGAEKIASIFQWNATFVKDTESLEMLGLDTGLVAFKCTLSKGNKYVGEGRGAASLSKNNGDPNKCLKMAQKSAFIDAVLRSSGLSDFFTQDLEDMNVNDIGQPQVENPKWPKETFPPSDKQMETIKKNMGEKNITEADLMDEGFPALKDLTGGKEGTASEVIGYLFKFSKYSNGLSAPTEEDRIIHQFTKDLEECTTPEMYAKVAGEIKIAYENGRLSDNGWAIMVKTCKVITKQIQEKGLTFVSTGQPINSKTSSQLAFEKGLEKSKQFNK